MAKDFFKDVPQTLEANLAYRIALRKRAESDPAFQRAMLTACKYDVLFWLSAFCWVYEPRPRFGRDGRLLPKQIPFIPWVHQIPVIRSIRENLGIRDIGIEKSRGEGMSWIGVLLALHDWLFDDMAKIGLVSNTEKKADDPGNMDSLMAKIDWELTKLPRWMAGRKDVDWTRNVTDHSLVNKRNLSQINAFAATGDAGRAGRYKWFMPDELAFWDRGKDSDFMTSIRGSTDSRLVISTPNGNDGAYYHFMHTPSNALRLQLHWTQNNTKNRGLYTLEAGKPVAVDPLHNPLAPEYEPLSPEVVNLYSRLRAKGFKLEGKPRSPWYDNECDRADATPVSIAQELDLDYGGSMYRIFGTDFFDRARSKVMPPLHRGILSFHPETLEPEFDTSEDGPVLLWTSLSNKGIPPLHPYVVSADISSGLGGSYTSNSVAQVIDLLKMEQVLEFATNTVEPSDFADLCIAIAKLFHDAYLSWEHNGPGSAFTKRVLAQKYSNIYLRPVPFKRGRKKTKEAGWFTTDRTKETMFSEFNRSVKHGELLLRSEALVKECGQYVRLKGKIESQQAVKTVDDSSVSAAHGDRVMAMIVGLMAARDRPHGAAAQKQEIENNPLPGTIAERMKLREAAAQENLNEWDDRDMADLTQLHFQGGKFRHGW